MQPFIIPILLSLIFVTTASADECTIHLTDSLQTDNSIKSEIQLSNIKKLAGIKLVMNYAENAYTYKEIKKSKATSSLLSVVNDKHPGKLIVVMAGARGISGKDVSLMSLYFTPKEKKQNLNSPLLSIKDVELMSEDLKELKCSVDAFKKEVSE